MNIVKFTSAVSAALVAGALVAQDALIFHADATSGITAVTNDIGKIEVTEWKSKLNNGWSAVPFYDAKRPTLMRADDLNGDYVVDMGKAGEKQAMLFAKDGETVEEAKARLSGKDEA